MKIEIETARNGFIIRTPPDGPEYAENVLTIASDDRVEASRELLAEILDIVGPVGSRYDEARVRVIIEPGDKWEPTGPCDHRWVSFWEYQGERRWRCRCGVRFAPAPDLEDCA